MKCTVVDNVFWLASSSGNASVGQVPFRALFIVREVANVKPCGTIQLQVPTQPLGFGAMHHLVGWATSATGKFRLCCSIEQGKLVLSDRYIVFGDDADCRRVSRSVCRLVLIRIGMC